MQRPWITGSGRVAIAVIGFLAGFAPCVMGQVPSRIPSDPEAQIFDLIKRVTALEEQLAALTSGKATLRVKAPFQVIDPAGDPILQVLDGPSAKSALASGVVIASDPGSGVEGLVMHNGAHPCRRRAESPPARAGPPRSSSSALAPGGPDPSGRPQRRAGSWATTSAC